MSSDGKDSANLGEDRLKHLEFIQNIISRLAGNSFWLKGWSVTLVAAIFVLATRNDTMTLLFTALLPTFAFWGLDALYVGQERIFRAMHKDIVAGNVKVMVIDTTKYERKWKGWICDLFSRSVWPFHVPVILVVVAIAIISTMAGSG
jgi:hypothetical protein